MKCLDLEFGVCVCVLDNGGKEGFGGRVGLGRVYTIDKNHLSRFAIELLSLWL